MDLVEVMISFLVCYMLFVVEEHKFVFGILQSYRGNVGQPGPELLRRRYSLTVTGTAFV